MRSASQAVLVGIRRLGQAWRCRFPELIEDPRSVNRPVPNWMVIFPGSVQSQELFTGKDCGHELCCGGEVVPRVRCAIGPTKAAWVFTVVVLEPPLVTHLLEISFVVNEDCCPKLASSANRCQDCVSIHTKV